MLHALRFDVGLVRFFCCIEAPKSHAHTAGLNPRAIPALRLVVIDPEKPVCVIPVRCALVLRITRDADVPKIGDGIVALASDNVGNCAARPFSMYILPRKMMGAIDPSIDFDR